ncbi:MAG TPA: hypothetical protein DIW47_06010 [Bacteroidetes bacterium]|nr:hypothetical protein [Bacteroidota bacterium]
MPARQIKYLLLNALIYFGVSGSIFAQTANFTSDVVDGCSPLTVNFQDLSSGSGLSYLWDFGNGNLSTQKNPGAIYIQDGTYTIKLKVWNASGSDSIIKTAYIRVFAKPVAKFGLSTPVSGCAPAQVSFRDSSQAGSYPIQSWLYDFGDGSVSNTQHPQHTYQQSGNYSVSLQITDTKGCSHVISRNNYVRVTAPFQLDFSATNPVSCAPPLTTSFNVSILGGIAPYTYLWDFDDGNTSTQSNPNHTFNGNKVYNVRLQVTDANGCMQSKQKNAVNTKGPQANYSLNATSGCPPFLLKVKDNSIPLATSSTLSWQIGSFQSSNPDTSLTFTLPGSYDVVWRVYGVGCGDSLVHRNKITVYPSPELSITASDTLLCAAYAPVQFFGHGKDIVRWMWTFDNKDTSMNQNPATVFLDSAKNYTIRLDATNIYGCNSTLIKKEYIKKLTTVLKIDSGLFSGCFPFTTGFGATGNAMTPILYYLWRFGNGDSAFGKSVSYSYPDTGSYLATVEIRDELGCVVQVEQLVQLGVKPRPFFSADTTIGCSLGLKPKFTSHSQDSSDVEIDSYHWQFYHAVIGSHTTISHQENPGTIYHLIPGKYQVKLTVENNGCFDSLVKEEYITVLGPFVAAGSLDPCKPDIFVPNIKSYGGHVKWWEFSDGTSVYGIDSAAHTFNSTPWSASFYITDTITGCWDSVKYTSGVIREFNAYPQFEGIHCAPASISYKSFLHNVDTFWYEFGNGFITSDSSFTVKFDEPGIYWRKLTLVNNDGCVKELMDSFEIEIKGVKAEGRILNDSFCVPGKVSLLDLTQNYPDIVEKKWVINNYGEFDVTADTMKFEFLQAPYFQNNGMQVSLVLLDDFGCTSQKDFQIYPFKPSPTVSINQEPGCNQARYRFKVLNVGKAGYEPMNYTWYYPGGSSNSTQFLETLPPDLWHDIVLQSIDNFGCTSMDTFPVYGKGSKIATGFDVSPKFSACPPLLVSFSDTSLPGEDPIISWKWDFGDGTTSTLKNPKKNYLVPGDYSIKLQVEDAKGCKSERIIPGIVLVKGPTGSYSFTPDEACEHIEVNFSSSNNGATKTEWDLGDGNLGYGTSLRHTYNRPGRYIPLMILSNDEGCKYALPPQDTIFVRESPLAAFVSNEACVRTPQTLKSTSLPVEGTIVEELWYYQNAWIDSGKSITKTFNTPGTESVLLRVKTNYGCIDSIIQDVNVPGIAIKLMSPDSLLCLGEPAVYEVVSAIFMDSITGYSWNFGDGDSLHTTQNLVQHQYPNLGPYLARVEALSAKGCSDRSPGPYMMIGDTVPPPAPFVHRVSVGTNMEYIAEFTPSKQIDFNQYLLELQEEGSDFYQVANRAVRNDTLFVHPSLNTLHQVYRFRVREENACGKISGITASAAHGSIELMATPDTNLVHLNWNPYEGWLPGYYVIERENETDPTLFDSLAFVPADSLHYADTLIRCHADPNYRIRAVHSEEPHLFSQSDTSKASPPHRPELPIHDLKRISVEYDREILAEWIEPLYSKFPLTGYLPEYSKDGNTYYSVQDWLDMSQNQLTKSPLLVDDQSYYFRIRVKDSCGDIGPPGTESRSILLRTETDSMERPVLKWSSYLGWEKIPDHYVVERIEPDGSILELAAVGPTDTVYVDEITEDVGRPDYCYRITAFKYPEHYPLIRNVWSHSNISCAPVRSRIFVPNAFSPNGDYLNDHFEVKGMYVYRYHIQIFTRWGEKIFDSESFSEFWDGQYKGAPCQEDVYIYVIDALGTDGKRYHLKGNITLLP